MQTQFCPQPYTNLAPVHDLADEYGKVDFRRHHAYVIQAHTRPWRIISTATFRHGLYALNTNKVDDKIPRANHAQYTVSPTNFKTHHAFSARTKPVKHKPNLRSAISSTHHC